MLARSRLYIPGPSVTTRVLPTSPTPSSRSTLPKNCGRSSGSNWSACRQIFMARSTVMWLIVYSNPMIPIFKLHDRCQLSSLLPVTPTNDVKLKLNCRSWKFGWWRWTSWYYVTWYQLSSSTSDSSNELRSPTLNRCLTFSLLIKTDELTWKYIYIHIHICN